MYISRSHWLALSARASDATRNEPMRRDLREVMEDEQTGLSFREEGEIRIENGQKIASETFLKENIELVSNGFFLNTLESPEKCADDADQNGATRNSILSADNMAGFSVVSLSEYDGVVGDSIQEDTAADTDEKKMDEWLKGVKNNISQDAGNSDDDPDDPARVCEMDTPEDEKLSAEGREAVVTFKEGAGDYLELVIKTRAGEQVYKIKSNITLDTLQPLSLQQVLSLQVTDDENDTDTPQDTNNKNVQSLDQNTKMDGNTVDEDTKFGLVSEVSVEQPVEHSLLYSSICDTLGRKNKVFPCPVDECTQVYNKECKLKIHLMSHEDARPFKCKLEGCDWAFTSFYRLKRHLLTHIGTKDFICDEPGCCSRFTTIYNLNSHKELHKRQNSFPCRLPNCDKKFVTRRKMELHLKDHSDIEAPYKCPLESCGKSYYSANFLASHLRVHQYGKDDLKCPFPNCGKCFLRLCQLKLHLRQHTGERPYACDYQGCNWTFSSASKLTRHMRKHTGDRRYVCSEAGCGKSFMRPEHLKGHVVIHSGVRPFQCPHPNCDISFTAKSSLYVHLKKHKGDSQKVVYACPVTTCTKKYSCKGSLRQHFIKVHAAEISQVNIQGIALESDQEMTGIGTLEDLVHEATGMPISVISNGTATVEIPETAIIDSSELLLQQSALTTQLLTSTGTVSGDLLLANSQLATMSTAQLIVTPDLLVPSLSMDGNCLESCIPQELLSLPDSTGGSARTDYSSNLILSSRAKRRRLLQQQFKLKDAMYNESRTLDGRENSVAESGILSSADVVLSSAIALPEPSIANQFAHTQLLQDDPPTSDIDHLLNTELPVPLLVESSVSNAVGEFSGSTINLQDLE